MTSSLDELFVDLANKDPGFVKRYRDDVAEERAQLKAVCRYLRGEVERLGKANALLVCENMRLEGEFQEFTKPGIYARLVVRTGEPRLMDCDEEYDT